MTSEKQILENLKNVIVPEVERSIIDLNLVRKINSKEDNTTITLAATALGPVEQEFITAGIKASLRPLKINNSLTFTLYNMRRSINDKGSKDGR